MKIISIIDMQKDFIDGSLGTPEAKKAVENATKWLRKNLTEEDVVLITKDTHYGNYFNTPEGKNLPVLHCIYEADGWRLWPSLFKVINSKSSFFQIFHKSTFGCDELATTITKLIKRAKENDKPVEIIFMGLCTDICVMANVCLLQTMIGGWCDTPITVLGNCCAGSTPKGHKAALQVMKASQIRIM